MKIPTTLPDLLEATSAHTRAAIARQWADEPGHGECDAVPGDARLYRLIDSVGTEDRWTLFDVLDQGGVASARLYPRRVDATGQRIAFDEDALTERGLVFALALGPERERHYVLCDELRPAIHRYRSQLLLMQVRALLDEFDRRAVVADPIVLPEQIQPRYALSHLLASSDPEGFRFPLSRALAIPDMFPASVKRVLKRMLHEFYLVFLPCLGELRADRDYPLGMLVRLASALAALLSHHHTPRLERELCRDDRRPFASPNTLVSGARRAFWRSFLVLFLDQFLTPIGATRTVGDRFQVTPQAFGMLDLEVKRPEWLRAALVELGVEAAEGSDVDNPAGEHSPV